MPARSKASITQRSSSPHPANVHITPLPIAGALLLQPDVYADERGYFKELYRTDRYEELGVTAPFIQDSLSSSKHGVLRGLHGDPQMAKLVQALQGEAWDVIVDVRPESPSYLRWHAEYLRGDEHRQIYIPAGCLHGFFVTGEATLMLYKHTMLYDPAREFGVAWNDADIAITWPLDRATPILSTKDAAHPTLRERGFAIPSQRKERGQ